MVRMANFFFTLFTVLFFSGLSAFSASVDTVEVHSSSMDIKLKTVVILPESYDHSSKKFPVVYLLHGYSGNHGNWVNKAPVVTQLADEHESIIICPDGGFSSWYFDSPLDSSFRYETFVAKELVDFVDKNFRTIPEKAGRAITGLSMGGHGALFLAFNHPETFGCAGSMSGGVDLRPFPNNWDISKRIGAIEKHPENWEKYSVISQIAKIEGKPMPLIIDCGVDDFFFLVNQQLHVELLNKKIPHDFIARPGKHNWEYWSNAIPYQMLFFNNFFNRK